MDARIAAVARAVAGAPPVRVFVAEWLDPPFAAGHWLPEMVAAAGGVEVLGRAGDRRIRPPGRTSQAAAPELIVAAACGFDAARIAQEAAGMVFPCRTVAVDANAHYSRPAPRLAEGVEQLAFLLHPGLAPDPGLPWIELEPAWTRWPSSSRAWSPSIRSIPISCRAGRARRESPRSWPRGSSGRGWRSRCRRRRRGART